MTHETEDKLLNRFRNEADRYLAQARDHEATALMLRARYEVATNLADEFETSIKADRAPKGTP